MSKKMPTEQRQPQAAFAPMPYIRLIKTGEGTDHQTTYMLVAIGITSTIVWRYSYDLMIWEELVYVQFC